MLTGVGADGTKYRDGITLAAELELSKNGGMMIELPNDDKPSKDTPVIDLERVFRRFGTAVEQAPYKVNTMDKMANAGLNSIVFLWDESTKTERLGAQKNVAVLPRKTNFRYHTTQINTITGVQKNEIVVKYQRLPVNGQRCGGSEGVQQLGATGRVDRAGGGPTGPGEARGEAGRRGERVRGRERWCGQGWGAGQQQSHEQSKQTVHKHDPANNCLWTALRTPLNSKDTYQLELTRFAAPFVAGTAHGTRRSVRRFAPLPGGSNSACMRIKG